MQDIANQFADALDIANWRLTPYQVLVLGFALLIAVGTALLMLPASSRSGQPPPFIDALFTATSAVCVTGLIVVDTGTYWSLFGQLVIIALIQAGGLGIMTLTTLAALIMGKKIRLRERLVMQEALNMVTLSGVVRLTQSIIKATILLEAIGGTILALRWLPEHGMRALYLGYWHAVSSFCNAGFDLFGEYRSLTGYVEDITVNLTVSFLIIFGGLGFGVIFDVWNNRRFENLCLHSKAVIISTGILVICGMTVIYAMEADNPATLGGLSWSGKLLASYFQSVTPRTAGYNTVDMSQLEDATLFFIIILMFIGASPASTGGGIKTTTAAILVMAIWALVTGREDANLFLRRIPKHLVYKAFSIAFISAALVIFVTMMLSLSERLPFIRILFEVTSAFGTVGLSTGITPGLSVSSKYWLIVTMFAGRVGPVTLALAIALRKRRGDIQYPEGQIVIG
ncbi:MAG: TrkH family potassium uptake protein [Negativicutes bacterium]|nr:TrkH family potassium uptake protein [Negativicutes bacterium]